MDILELQSDFIIKIVVSQLFFDLLGYFLSNFLDFIHISPFYAHGYMHTLLVNIVIYV